MFDFINNKLLASAIRSGIDYFKYWDMSIDEVLMVIENHRIAEEERSKLILIANYTSAIVTAQAVGRLLGNGAEVSTLHDMFPKLFEEEKEQSENWQEVKERMFIFADKHNEERRKRK